MKTPTPVRIGNGVNLSPVLIMVRRIKLSTPPTRGSVEEQQGGGGGLGERGACRDSGLFIGAVPPG